MNLLEILKHKLIDPIFYESKETVNGWTIIGRGVEMKHVSVVYCHGGMGGTGSYLGYDEVKFLARQGYPVTVVNYGAIPLKWKGALGAHVQEVWRCASYLPEPRVAMGISRGGVVAQFAMIRNPELYDAGVIVVAPTRLDVWRDTTMLQPKQRDRALFYFMDEEDDISKASPILWPEAFRPKPLLLMYGSEDKVVPSQQGKLMFDAILDGNVSHHFCKLYPYGHGLINKEDPQRDVAGFLSKITEK